MSFLSHFSAASHHQSCASEVTPAEATGVAAAADTAAAASTTTATATTTTTTTATAAGFAEGSDFAFAPQQLDYIPLHVHSDYSIMDGLESVEAIVKQAVKLKIPAIALTDLTNVCGYIKFYNACISNGIKPIMGADLVVEEPPRMGETPHTFRLTVIAMDRVGKQNLYDLLSNAWLRSDAGEFNAHTQLEEFEKFNEGLIVLNGFRGDIARFIADHQEKELNERLRFYLKNFGDRFCFEITRTGREGEITFENAV